MEAAIAASQEVLYPGRVHVGLDIGIFKGIMLLPTALKAAKNPDGATLKDVLAPGTYSKWRVLKQTYIGDDDDVERYRPIFAEDQLMGAIERRHRSPVPLVGIQSVVNKAARKHKVKVRTLPTVTRKFGIENPRAVLKAAQKMDFAEGECFDRNLDKIQRAIDEGRFSNTVFINAWATGDLETLRNTPGGAFWREDCTMAAVKAVLKSPTANEGVKKGLDVLDVEPHGSSTGSPSEPEAGRLEAASYDASYEQQGL